MRPSVFKLIDAMLKNRAAFDGWITLTSRNGDGDKVGGSRVLLDDDGAIVYGLGGGHTGKKLGEAFTEIKSRKAFQRGTASKTATEARTQVEKYAGLKIAPGDAEKSEQYAKEYAESDLPAVREALSKITSRKELKEQFDRYYNGAEMRVERASRRLMNIRQSLPRDSFTPEKYEAFREAYHQMQRSTPYYREGVRQAYEKRLKELESRRRTRTAAR